MINIILERLTGYCSHQWDYAFPWMRQCWKCLHIEVKSPEKGWHELRKV